MRRASALFFYLLDKLIIYLGGHEHAGSRFADLPLVEKGAEAGPFHGQFHIRIIENDVGGFAPQLQGDLFDGIGSHLHDLAPHFRAAGKGNLVHIRMRAQDASQFSARAGNDIEDAVGDPSRFGCFRDDEGAYGGIGSGLQDHAVPHDECRGNLPEGHGHGEIPWYDAYAYPDGFPPDKFPTRSEHVARDLYLFLPGELVRCHQTQIAQ